MGHPVRPGRTRSSGRGTHCPPGLVHRWPPSSPALGSSPSHSGCRSRFPATSGSMEPERRSALLRALLAPGVGRGSRCQPPPPRTDRGGHTPGRSSCGLRTRRWCSRHLGCRLPSARRTTSRTTGDGHPAMEPGGGRRWCPLPHACSTRCRQAASGESGASDQGCFGGGARLDTPSRGPEVRPRPHGNRVPMAASVVGRGRSHRPVLGWATSGRSGLACGGCRSPRHRVVDRSARWSPRSLPPDGTARPGGNSRDPGNLHRAWHTFCLLVFVARGLGCRHLHPRHRSRR